MIIARSPLRIPFFSGGSDIPAFYKREFGAALSCTISLYNYVSIHTTPNQLRFMYNEVEEHPESSKFKHNIVKEMLQWFEINGDLTISSISDVNWSGTGLGSSSAFAVALYKAMWTKYENSSLDPYYLAQDTCYIEINKCEFPIGKQDSFSSSYGGFNFFEFHANEEVTRSKVYYPHDFSDNFLLIHTGVQRNSSDILSNQKKDIELSEQKFIQAKKNRDLAYKAVELLKNESYDEFGKLLHESWVNKKTLNSSATNDTINNIYDRIINAGAYGGKLLGAGGGGFLLFYVPRRFQANVLDTIKSMSLTITPFKFVDVGTTIVFSDEI